MKRLLFVLLVLLFTLNACSVAYHSCIRLNNRLTSRTLDKCYRSNKNAFSLSSTYADFSVVWSYGADNIEVYCIQKGRLKAKNKYYDKDIKNITAYTFNNLEQIVYDECNTELDGDLITFVFDSDGEKSKIVLPVEINCFKKANYKSTFLNELVKDIDKYELWEIYDNQKLQ